jgi:DNA-binding beta-propeller fold protein YncE
MCDTLFAVWFYFTFRRAGLMSCCLSLLVLLLALSSHPVLAESYKVAGSIPIGGTGHWDYLLADSDNRRLYVSHNAEVVVVDLDSQEILGKIAVGGFSHGIAIAPDVNLGFITTGGSGTDPRKYPNEVASFDLKTLKIKERIKVGDDPDAIVYDLPSGRVFAFNGDISQATVINAKSGKVEKIIALGGKPEFSVSDGKGSVYVNLEDKSEIAQIDTGSLTVKAHWPLAPCEEPAGLAMDRENRRLFSTCGNKTMVVVDADTGKVIANLPIGVHPDGALYDPGTKQAFSSNIDATLTVVRQEGKDKYSVVDSVQTEPGARTMAMDLKTHTIYLSSAKFGPKPEGSRFPSVVPETFKVLILKQP